MFFDCFFFSLFLLVVNIQPADAVKKSCAWCFRCHDVGVRYKSSKAYIMTMMQGSSFCLSSRNAFQVMDMHVDRWIAKNLVKYLTSRLSPSTEITWNANDVLAILKSIWSPPLTQFSIQSLNETSVLWKATALCKTLSLSKKHHQIRNQFISLMKRADKKLKTGLKEERNAHLNRTTELYEYAIASKRKTNSNPPRIHRL